MKVAVAGLWHLGSVTAACLAAAGLHVTGLDDSERVAGLSAARAPLFEPALDDLLGAGIAAGRLRFTSNSAEALSDADLLWVTYDTPVDDEDRADVESVVGHVLALVPHLPDGAVVLVSSQLPVGTTSRLQGLFVAANPGRDIFFAYSPENLRLGKAIAAFTEAERIIVGCESSVARERLEPVLRTLGRPIVWMGIESAEMVKHTINAFLATCVTFINEIASICEAVGADAGEVEEGIRSEPRIGSRAYVTPGGAFGGGTLARDVSFLSDLAAQHSLSIPVIGGVIPSNRSHAGWAFRRAMDILKSDGPTQLAGRRFAILGLTYKPGTNTLRRSPAVELCRRLHDAGAEVRAHDPEVRTLPGGLEPVITLGESLAGAVEGADAVVVATEWPAFREIEAERLATAMRGRVILDGGGFLAGTLGASPAFSYYRVGRGK